MVALTALGNAKDVPARLRSLREALAAQPEPLKLDWNFAGTKTFLVRDGRLAASRGFLLELLAAVENPDRAAALRALDAVIAHQPAPPPG